GVFLVAFCARLKTYGGVFLVAFCARLKTYGALFGDKNHKAFSRFCLCGHEKSGLGLNLLLREI
ncbi:hypothetical protein, partial [Pseudomonas aeruginosa]|uniref:hypothetical protein n=1 Tax=Pseudomonas aeruginosa TaxID=287 RepID=UPI001EDED1ED